MAINVLKKLYEQIQSETYKPTSTQKQAINLLLKWIKQLTDA